MERFLSGANLLAYVCPGLLLVTAIVFGLAAVILARRSSRANHIPLWDMDRLLAPAVCGVIAVLALLFSIVMAVIMALI